MGELYNVLREFSRSLLLLRLEETAVGAAIAIVVALVVLPVRTQDAVAAAERALLDDLAVLLGDVRDRLARPERSSDLLLDSRHVDARLHQLALVARPVGGATLLGLAGRRAERDLSRWTATAYRARALADAVRREEPGSLLELAEVAEQLRAAVAGEGPLPMRPEARGAVARVLRDLLAVVGPLVPVEVAEDRAEVAAGA